MKNVFGIGHNDLRLFLKRKSAYVWLFVMPLAFVYFMGFANHGPGDPGNRRPAVLIDNADTNFLGRVFLDELGAQNMNLVHSDSDQSAARAIRIPPDLTARVLEHKQAKLQFVRHESSDESDAAIVELRLVRALIAMNGHILQAATSANPPSPLTESQLRAVIALPDPVLLDSRFAGRKPVPSGFNFSLPSILVMYLMMNLLMFGGATMAAERRNGVIKRLISCPVSRGELVLGKIYGLMLLGAVQIIVFLSFGRFVLHVNLGANLPAVALTLLIFSWAAGSFGVLVGSFTSAEERVGGICIFAAMLMAALGGCWWPLEVAPPSQKIIALCLPTGWALQALHQVISFGGGFDTILKPLAVLSAFAIGATALAARFFRA
jgi:ABC-type multidrug transport system permease subunit